MASSNPAHPTPATGPSAPAPNSASAAATGEKDRLPGIGDIIHVDGRQFKLIDRLGEGGYGNVFLSEDDSRKVAVKCEKYSHSQVHIEVAVLRAANAAKCKHFCELHAYGTSKPDYAFVIMSLLGKDLHKLRCEAPEKKFSTSTALGVGFQTLKAIEELHKIGYISRDVKPGNFAPGNRETRQNKIVFMIDFGLCRKYLDKTGVLIPSRGETGWRGTTRYGSLAAHARQDLGRKDDLESWFYMLIESTRGTLPWRMMTDRAGVLAAKKHARESGRTQFLFDCPKPYEQFLQWIDQMVYDSAPEYEKFYKVLKDLCEEKNCRLKDTWDWDDATNSTTTNTMSSYSEKETRAHKSTKENGKEKEAK